MEPITEFLRKTNKGYPDVVTLIGYCNMLAKKQNEVIDENEKLKKEIDTLKKKVME